MKKRKLSFMIIVALIITAAYYGVYVTHNSKSELTELALLNVEALANGESDYAEPIKLKSCYIATSSTLLPNEPEIYVTNCNSCSIVKCTTAIGTATCAGSQIIYLTKSFLKD